MGQMRRLGCVCRGDVLCCLRVLAQLIFKAFYLLFLMFKLLCLKVLIISFALIITSIMIINFHELCKCFNPVLVAFIR
jgi:hypothetical protein